MSQRKEEMAHILRYEKWTRISFTSFQPKQLHFHCCHSTALLTDDDEGVAPGNKQLRNKKGFVVSTEGFPITGIISHCCGQREWKP